jgi:Domain of unknown function (DUF4375)
VQADHVTEVDPWSEYERLSGEELSSLTPAERRFLSIGVLRTEVNNGGFHQYLFNSAGDSAPDAADAAQMAGAHDLAALVRQAVGRLDVAEPRDRRARQNALDDLEPDSFEDLDEAFYALEASTDLDDVMAVLMG